MELSRERLNRRFAGIGRRPFPLLPIGCSQEKTGVSTLPDARTRNDKRGGAQKAAEKEKLDYYVQRSGIEAPHFVFYVKEGLVEEYGLSQVNEGGLKITTTLDLDVQKMAEEVVAEEISGLERYKVSNGAVVVTEPKTGEILAMVGSKDYFADDIDGKFNVTTALRQPGSSIKPLNYAIGRTENSDAASIFIDE